MVISPYRTSVTAAMQDANKRVDPDLYNRRAKPRVAKHHQPKSDAK